MEKGKKGKLALFKAIENKDEALKTIKSAAYGFLFIAILQGAIAFFLAPILFFDAILFLLLALLLMWLKSRVVAILLLLLSTGIVIMTVLTKSGMVEAGGTNIFLALMIFWIAIKSVEATFKLHGKFKQ